MPEAKRTPLRRRRHVGAALLLAAALTLSGCGAFGGAPELPPTEAAPAPTLAAPTAQPATQRITIGSPAANSAVTSPIAVSGSTTLWPFEGNLNYRLFGPDGAMLAQGNFTATGEPGGPGAFGGEIAYSLEQAGNGRLEVLEFSAADGSLLAISSIPIQLAASAPQPAGPTPTALPPPPPAAQQQILIDSPTPGTIVGSPVVITGRTVKLPAGNALSYTIRDAAGAALGSGVFPVSPAAGETGSFTASISFNLPPNGGAVRLEIFEPGAAGAAPVASATLQMNVAPPQAILIDSPPPGTTVGSPVVLTGRTARFPFQGNLGYRVLDGGARQLGAGIIAVQGAPGGPASFTASINFNLPPNGGRVTVELVDQNAANSQIAATARIDLNVAPPQQAIVIESPPANTLVGSPMTVTGRTVRMPAGGALSYRVRAGGQQIGQGSFGVVGSQDGGARFNAQVVFTAPAAGRIDLELLELDPASGQVRASSTLTLQVAATLPPTPTATALPTSQQVLIDTPAAETVVGSPVVITGRTALPPRTGRLYYVVRSATRETLGQGEFPVAVSPGVSANVPFAASITFAEPPQGGRIIVEIYDRDAVGNVVANAIVQLQVNPRPYP
jgi:hypothetical protein